MGGKLSKQQTAHLKELRELTDSSSKISSNGGTTLPRLKDKELIGLLSYIWKECPSYPAKGSLKISTWTKLGEHFHAAPRAPVQILTAWRVVMECLMIHHKFDTQKPAEIVPPPYDSVATSPAKLYPALTGATCPCPDKSPAASDTPPNVNPQRGGHIIRAMQIARQSGQLSAEELETCTMFPVTWVVPAGADADAPAQPVHTHVDYKHIKEIKNAVRDYGLQSRYVSGLLNSLCNGLTEMLLADWRSLFGMILTPAQYVIWNSEYDKQAVIAINAGLPQNVTADHIQGTGTAITIAQQQNSDRAAFPIIKNCAFAALRKVDDNQGKPLLTFTKIVQAPTEDYSSFVSRLQLALERQIDNADARGELCMKLAYENANSDCQKVLQPIANKPGVVLADFLQACRIVGTTSHQMAALASAITTSLLPPSSSSPLPQDVLPVARPAGNCFNCGKPGHFKSQCRAPGGGANRNSLQQTAKPKTVCPKCKKGFHWANQCRSFDQNQQNQGN